MLPDTPGTRAVRRRARDEAYARGEGARVLLRRARRRSLAIGGACLVLVGGGLIGVAGTTPTTRAFARSVPSADAPPATTPTTAAPTPPTTAPPKQPNLADIGVDDRPVQPASAAVPAPADGLGPVIGRIQIPKIGLDRELRDDISQPAIDAGPAHWPGTSMPGGPGNVVVAGHRVSHGGPFRRVGELRPGDEIRFVTSAGVTRYVVTELFVVLPDGVWITDETGSPILTLFTCHPIGSSAERLVVRARLAP
jgi:sortase A